MKGVKIIARLIGVDFSASNSIIAIKLWIQIVNIIKFCATPITATVQSKALALPNTGIRGSNLT
jgi:hypothetical protein